MKGRAGAIPWPGLFLFRKRTKRDRCRNVTQEQMRTKEEQNVNAARRRYDAKANNSFDAKANNSSIHQNRLGGG